MREDVIIKKEEIKAEDIFPKVAAGDVNVIKLIREQGFNPNLMDKDGDTLLHIAVTAYAKFLKEKRIGKIQDNEQSNNANYSKLIEELITEVGANPNSLNRVGQSSLHIAVAEGHIEIIKLLIGLRASVHVMDTKSQTPLHMRIANPCAETLMVEIIKLLIEAGSGIKSADQWLGTPLHYAANWGHVEVMKLLLEKNLKVNKRNVVKQTSLHLAAEQNNLTALQLLSMQEEIEINATDNQKQTPLHLSASGRYTDHYIKHSGEIIKLLLKGGANIDPIDINGKTPLWLAVEKGHTEPVKVLLTNDSTLDIEDNHLNTLLHIAAKNGFADIAALLTTLFIKKGFSINLKNKDEQTPLHLAAEGGFVDIVKNLVAVNANGSLRDKNGQTPLQLAFEKGHQQVVSLLAKSERFLDINLSSKEIDKIKKGKVEIGRGTFGHVYKSIWNGTTVALKELTMPTMIKTSNDNEQDKELEREIQAVIKDFKREATTMSLIMSRKNSENIVKFYGAFFTSKYCCIVMEYMPGGSLFSWFNKKVTIPWEIRIKIAIDIGGALQYLHQRNIIHADIKSQNVLLSSEKVDDSLHAKLGDFGSTKARLEDYGTILGPACSGTRYWMAPELYTSTKNPNPKSTKDSDIYSFGVLLYELAQNGPPDCNVIDKSNIKETNAPILFQELINKCISEKPEQRPDIEEILKILEQTKQQELEQRLHTDRNSPQSLTSFSNFHRHNSENDSPISSEQTTNLSYVSQQMLMPRPSENQKRLSKSEEIVEKKPEESARNEGP